MGKLIAVSSLPAHFLSRTDRIVALRDALRADKAVLLVIDDVWRRSDVEAFDPGGSFGFDGSPAGFCRAEARLQWNSCDFRSGETINRTDRS